MSRIVAAVLLALMWLSVALADEATDPEGLLGPEYNEGNGKYHIYIGAWSRCTVYHEKSGKLQRVKPDGAHQSDSLVHRPHIGVQRRQVQCRAGDATIVDSKLCGESLLWVGATRTCIPVENCTVGEWLPWRTRADGTLVRTRIIKRLDQGGGADCGLVQEWKPFTEEPSAHWAVGPWGQCIVAVEHTATPLAPADDDAAADDAIYEDEDSDEELDRPSDTASCGGGVQRREVSCVRADGTPLHPAHCKHAQQPTLVQPCEVPCPRDCEVGPWSDWEPCQPTDGCPLYPVQQLTSTGYSVRHRRVVSASSGGGAPCPPLEEKRSCPAPLCASWQPLPWGPCQLHEPYAICGPGRRNREIRCVGHDGKEAERAWCSASGAPARSERCRIACEGDCVVSAWGPWAPCSAPCANNHTRPTTTRRRHILAHSTPDGWPCPSEEQLVQNESCNTHGCATYSWLATPWGPCKPRQDYQPSTNYTELQNEDADDVGEDEEPCIEEGEMTRDVMCVQNNADVVKEALCTPLHRPASRRACTIRCRRGCRVEAWQPWSPCPNTCGTEPAKQVRIRKVQGGPNCGPLQETRLCPESQSCAQRAVWVTGDWSPCYLPPGETCGFGYNIRSLWCGSKSHRVETGNCAAQRVPQTIQRCTAYCEEDLYPMTCEEICQDPAKYLDSNDPEYPPDCVCNGLSLELLPADSDCILPPGTECGQGRSLRAARCMKNGINLPLDTCKKYLPLTGPNRVRRAATEGYVYDEEFPSLLSSSCTVSCAMDCTIGPWGQWGPCVPDPGSKAAFRFRTREVISQATGGGRECGPTLQRATCRVPEPRWQLGEWAPCAPTRAQCGRALVNRTVTCVDQEGKKLDPSACEMSAAGPAPLNQTSCRAPCPKDCVVSAWSEWSPCEMTKSGGRRDRTRVPLRPATPGGEGCPYLVVGQDCTPHTYSWHVAPWDDCQPLGGSPCGEGVKKRSVRCLRDDGVFVNDSFCPASTSSEARESWCYVPCGVDCQLGEWGAWNSAACVCDDHSAKRHHIVRSRNHLTSAVWPGRACPPTEQRVPCPQEPCLRLVATPALGCHILPMGGPVALRPIAVTWTKQGKSGPPQKIAVMHGSPSLQVSGKEGPMSTCGWGTRMAMARCELGPGYGFLQAWRCPTQLPGRIIVPTLHVLEATDCEVKCGCKEKNEPKQPAGPWGAWGPCRGGARSRIRHHMQQQANAASLAPNRHVSIEWANCSEWEAPALQPALKRPWLAPDVYYNGYVEGSTPMLIVIWTATIVVLAYGIFMIYRGVVRFIRSKNLKTITKV